MLRSDELERELRWKRGILVRFLLKVVEAKRRALDAWRLSVKGIEYKLVEVELDSVVENGEAGVGVETGVYILNSMLKSHNGCTSVALYTSVALLCEEA